MYFGLIWNLDGLVGLVNKQICNIGLGLWDEITGRLRYGTQSNTRPIPKLDKESKSLPKEILTECEPMAD